MNGGKDDLKGKEGTLKVKKKMNERWEEEDKI